MEDLQKAKYLRYPEKIKFALKRLEECSCEDLTFENRFRIFEQSLGIKGGDGLPITAVQLEGPTIRARVHEDSWTIATQLSEIGVNPNSQQGRAHAKGYHIFYGSNRKETAVYEVLQGKENGIFDVTLGEWINTSPLWLVNFVDGRDEIFSKIPFVHSDHHSYLTEWPALEKESATLLIDYFKEKFKQPSSPSLYNITNVLAGMCFSLQDIDGIGFGATSDNFEGYNVAIRNFDRLKCRSVERWRVIKIHNKIIARQRLQTGSVLRDGKISWQE